MVLVCDPARPRRVVRVTEAELPLIQAIREEKGIGPVMIVGRPHPSTDGAKP